MVPPKKQCSHQMFYMCWHGDFSSVEKKRSEYPEVEAGCTLDNYMGQLETMMIQLIHHGSDMYRFTIGGVAGKKTTSMKLPPLKTNMTSDPPCHWEILVHSNGGSFPLLSYVSFQGLQKWGTFEHVELWLLCSSHWVVINCGQAHPKQSLIRDLRQIFES